MSDETVEQVKAYGLRHKQHGLIRVSPSSNDGAEYASSIRNDLTHSPYDNPFVVAKRLHAEDARESGNCWWSDYGNPYDPEDLEVVELSIEVVEC